MSSDFLDGLDPEQREVAECLRGPVSVLAGAGTVSYTHLDVYKRQTEDDEVAEHVPEPEPGTVQLITVHGSKGLEWDLVAIPRLVADEFPGSAREGLGWLRPGQLPDELRGDAAARPRLGLEIVDLSLIHI